MIWYGGDYNPEQWPEGIWDEDVRLMQQGGISLVSLGIFSWAKLEPREGEFDFAWLDRIMDKLHEGGIRIDLATATASPPPWLTHRYPEVLPVTDQAVRLQVGSRQQYCPSSPIYREKAAILVTKLAERYGSHPGVELWHIGNEYGCHVSHCYCDVSAAAFRGWLEAKYGTPEAVNEAWGTAFWSQHYNEFAEIFPPGAEPTFHNPGQQLDFDRFSSDELLECFRSEVRVLREITPDIPLTTNFMGFFKDADYWKWAKEVDIVSDDLYPDPADRESPARAAMTRDLMRSLGEGKPWLLMEQSPSAVNWRPRNAVKVPGQQRAWSLQAVARGADGILFFQWRQSIAGAEKFHSGMVPHGGTDTRVWREIEALGAELRTLGALEGQRVRARVAIAFDWDSWRSIEQEAVPTRLSYVDLVFAWYRRLWAMNVAVDFVSGDSDLGDYSLVIVPSMFVTTAATLERFDAFANAGGQLLVTFQSGVTDENARIVRGGYLGSLQQTLGIWIEEFAPFAGADVTRDDAAPVPEGRIRGGVTGEASAVLWAEFLHLRGAEAEASFVGGALDGWPAITRNETGDGAAWYAATQPGEAAMEALLSRLLADAGVAPTVADLPRGVEAIRRGESLVLINHTHAVVAIDGVDLEPQGVRISSVG